MYSKRQGPQLPLKRIITEAKDLLFADQFVSNLAWLLSRRSVSALHIPSYTGYHAILRSRVPVKKNFVGYLDCVDAPATEMSTVYVPIFTRFTFVLFSFHEKEPSAANKDRAMMNYLSLTFDHPYLSYNYYCDRWFFQ